MNSVLDCNLPTLQQVHFSKLAMSMTPAPAIRDLRSYCRRAWRAIPIRYLERFAGLASSLCQNGVWQICSPNSKSYSTNTAIQAVSGGTRSRLFRKLRQKERGLTRRLVQFTMTDPEPLLYHNEPILHDGRIVGRVTSGMFGHTVGRSIGLGYVVNGGGIVTPGFIQGGASRSRSRARASASRPRSNRPTTRKTDV